MGQDTLNELHRTLQCAQDQRIMVCIENISCLRNSDSGHNAGDLDILLLMPFFPSIYHNSIFQNKLHTFLIEDQVFKKSSLRSSELVASPALRNKVTSLAV